MAKRAATTELNHDNWNDEEPAEEAGTFRMASTEVTSKRVFKKAKRRMAENSETNDAFKEFSGFGLLKPTGTNNPFSSVLSGGGVFKSGFDVSTPQLKISPFVMGESEKKVDQKQTSNNNSNSRAEYLQQLRNLNESVVAWISKQVNLDPLGVLYPIINEYNGYLHRLAQEHSEDKNTPKVDLVLKCDLFSKKSLTQLQCLNVAILDWIKLHVSKNPLCILTPVFNDYAEYVKGFEDKSLKAKSVLNPSAKNVFGSSPIVSFKFNVAEKVPVIGGDNAKNDGDNDNYEPPKNEVQEVKEEDAFYSVRCKLFYKKEGKYAEKGVGSLYLKSIDGKTQLLVRAETNLGNILLNVFVVPKTPTSRVGKNNVTLVCIPNPPLDPKSSAAAELVTFLVRVKDAAEADELHKKLEENKK